MGEDLEKIHQGTLLNHMQMLISFDINFICINKKERRACLVQNIFISLNIYFSFFILIYLISIILLKFQISLSACVCVCVCVCVHARVCVLMAQSCPTLCDPLDIGFSKQEYWSGQTFSSPGYLPDSGIEPGSPTLQTDFLLIEPTGKPQEPIK